MISKKNFEKPKLIEFKLKNNPRRTIELLQNRKNIKLWLRRRNLEKKKQRGNFIDETSTLFQKKK